MSIFNLFESLDHAMTVKELASLLRLSPTTVYEMARRAAIPHYRLAGSIRFDPCDVERWLRDRRVEQLSISKRGNIRKPK
jgi:excisionase family DNA binding protein